MLNQDNAVKNTYLNAIKQFMYLYELFNSNQFSLSPYRQSFLRLLLAYFHNPLDESNRMLSATQPLPKPPPRLKTGARGKRGE